MQERKLSWLERALVFMVPTLKIRHQRWRTPWEQRERKAFFFQARFFFLAYAISYFFHYFYVDLPLKKQPIELWAEYRFGLASVALVGLFLTYTGIRNTKWYRWPLACTGLLCVFMQAQSMIWRKEIPYVYSVLLAVMAAISIRTSVFESILYMGICFVACIPGWLSRPEEIPYILSAAWAGLILVGLLRSRMSTDVDAFVAEQERLETQAQLIETQQDLTEQIRAFLPKEIYRRLTHLMSTEGKTVLQAMDEVLRPKDVLVACVYSDIRGSTKRTNSVAGYVQNSILPSQRASTEIVDRNGGIPKLAGDMIFAYFDSTDPLESLRSALICSIELTEQNILMNQELPERDRLNRSVIITFGRAIVGNTGGSEGSVDVSALGVPANMGSRLDQLNKEPSLSTQFSARSIILSAETGHVIEHLVPGLQLKRIDLKKAKVSVRDFPDATEVFVVEANQNSRQKLMSLRDKTSAEAYLKETYSAQTSSETDKRVAA